MKTVRPQSCTIGSLLREQANLFADQPALVATGQRYSYSQLNSAVNEAAKGFHALGVKPKDHVAILMGNKAQWVISFLALQCLGATAVCLNTWSTQREMEYALSHAEVTYLVAVTQFRRNDYQDMLKQMQPHAQRLPHLKKIVWVVEPGTTVLDAALGLDWYALLALGKPVDTDVIDKAILKNQPADIAVLLYTSGSTAAPKGILLEQGNWIENPWNIGERLGVTASDRLWLAVSLFWSFGCVNAMPNLLSHGACIVLQEHFDAEEALDLIEREKCSVIYGTPNMVQALLEHPSRPARNLSSLRTGAMIGTPEQIQMAVELGVHDICNIYGLSETYGNCAVIDHREPLDIRLQCVGQPLPGVTARICDMETGLTLPDEAVGEIRVKGPLFKSYFKEPEKTQASFDSEGYFCTGDLGMLDKHGRLYYKGRLKEMVKSGGINIAPIEVEEVLMRHPALKSAYVIGMPDPHLDEILVALLVAKEGQSVTHEALKAFCKKELAAYKVPAKFQWVNEQELPLTSTGKLQKMMLNKLVKS